jgi:hypothetical protein
LKADYHPDDESFESFDRFLFFFLCFFSLQDWLKAYTPEAHEVWKARFRGCLEWKICRDISNAFKHLKLTQSSLDTPLLIFRHYRQDDRHEVAIIVDGRVITLMEVARTLWSEASDFANETAHLLPPKARAAM